MNEEGTRLVSGLRGLARLLLILLNLIAGLALAGTLYLVLAETFFWKPEPKSLGPREAFFEGSIGTEFAPLAVVQVLPAMFPEFFQPAGEEAGDWIDQYGFIHHDNPHGMPLGFTVSQYRPLTGFPSPVDFVGIGCGTCHSQKLRLEDEDAGVIIEGAGSSSLNILGWFEAFRAAVLAEENPSSPRDHTKKAKVDYRLRMGTIQAALEKMDRPRLSGMDYAMVAIWLNAIRNVFLNNQITDDEPATSEQLRDANFQPAGPGRTRPFNTLTRMVLRRLAVSHSSYHYNEAYTKIPAIFNEDDREWAQFDGSMRDLNGRSALAAMTIGATVYNLAHPEISQNVIQATNFTRDLDGPAYTEQFPDHPIDQDAADRGAVVFRQHCAKCHGDRGPDGNWLADPEWAPAFGKVIPATAIGTDPERADIRHTEALATLFHARFWPEHPLFFDRDDLRPGNSGRIRGYVCGPIDGAFMRAPFLHNASVPTLAELINLVPRRDRYYRGQNLFDPEKVGLIVPTEADSKRYWLYDANRRGNANTGHHYPWAYDDPARDEAQLRDLLEYIKTL